jgi:AcrR family transcriptional regulator
MSQHAVTKRQRAPSRRSLQARARILDAAESVFARQGFDGASIRDIAERAGVQKANVNFHGGAKEDLFELILTRRADALAEARMLALAALDADPDWTLEALIAGFVRPLLDRAFGADPQWMDYARLVAIVSADDRWRGLTERLFDPVAQAYALRLARRYPAARADDIAAGIVFSVSAMLALCTAQWRIRALAALHDPPAREAMVDTLIRFCAAGVADILGAGQGGGAVPED